MFEFSTATTPSAASSRVSARRAASASIARVAASRSSCIAPPRKFRASSRPSTIFASVTVGSVPPRPYAAGPGTAPALCGPTLNGAARVDVRDRAAAGADRVQVDHRHEDR
jgi:hypothetical protein